MVITMGLIRVVGDKVKVVNDDYSEGDVKSSVPMEMTT